LNPKPTVTPSGIAAAAVAGIASDGRRIASGDKEESIETSRVAENSGDKKMEAPDAETGGTKTAPMTRRGGKGPNRVKVSSSYTSIPENPQS
jgi:2-methylcitrate dehydratase PrpD